MHLCVNKLTIIGSDDGLWPGRRQAGILLIGPYVRNSSDIEIRIRRISLKKMHLKMSSYRMAAILPRPQCVNHYLQSHHETAVLVSIGDKACLWEP